MQGHHPFRAPAHCRQALGEHGCLIVQELAHPLVVTKDGAERQRDARFAVAMQAGVHLLVSNGARAGLTGFVAGLARQMARHNVTINNLLPGPFLADRLRSGAIHTAQQQGRHVDEVLAERAKASPAGRVGDPAEFGDACAFLCAASSGFIVGQNLLLDGGAFNSSMS